METDMMELGQKMSGPGNFNGAYQKRALRSLLTWQDGALRTRTGKTMEDLATGLGMSRSNLDRYLSGRTPLGSEQFEAFADAFDTTKVALLRACFPVLSSRNARATESGEPTLRELLEAERVPEADIVQLERLTANQPTTLDLRRGLAQFAAEVARKRTADQGQRRRRA